MKLSEAIRLGALLHPQCFDTMRTYRYYRDGRRDILGTCALGAAEEAGYHAQRQSDWIVLAQCPEGCPLDGPVWLGNVVSHLNDYHRWTRERIADWVATVEAHEESAAVDASDPHAADPGNLTPRVKAFSSSC